MYIYVYIYMYTVYIYIIYDFPIFSVFSPPSPCGIPKNSILVNQGHHGDHARHRHQGQGDDPGGVAEVGGVGSGAATRRSWKLVMLFKSDPINGRIDDSMSIDLY